MIGAFLRNPVGWFLVQVSVFLGGLWLLTTVLPDHAPWWIGFPIFLAFLAGLLWLSLRLARRFHVGRSTSRRGAAREAPDV